MDAPVRVNPLDRAVAVAPAIAVRAAEHDRDASFPFTDFDDLHAAQLLALTVPADAGGAGLADAAAVLEVTGAANTSIADRRSTSPKHRARSPGQPNRLAPNHRPRCSCRTENPSLLGRVVARLVLDASERFTQWDWQYKKTVFTQMSCGPVWVPYGCGP